MAKPRKPRKALPRNSKPLPEREALVRRNKEMGKRITALRESLDLSKAELARRAGIPHGYMIVKYEKHGQIPHPSRLESLAEVLGTTTDYLMSGHEPASYVGATDEDIESFDVEEWLELMPGSPPSVALEMARHAWKLSESTVGDEDEESLPPPAHAPTLTPPTRSSSQSLVPPNEEPPEPEPTSSGMRSKRGAEKDRRVVRRKAR